MPGCSRGSEMQFLQAGLGSLGVPAPWHQTALLQHGAQAEGHNARSVYVLGIS